MLIRDRQEQILRLVNEKTRLAYADLTKIIGISDSTLRRDLSELQKKGLLKLVRGGAESSCAMLGRGEELIDRRYHLNSCEKEIIGQRAAKLIKPDDLVFIDSGSTTEKMCEFIKERKATYITIGLKHVMILSRSGLNAIIAPGKVKQLTEGLQGGFTIDFLSHFNFSIAFFGALGISEKGGLSTTDGEDAIIKSAVINRSAKSYVLSDHSKFGLDTAVSFGSLNSLTIITNPGPHVTNYKDKANFIVANKNN